MWSIRWKKYIEAFPLALLLAASGAAAGRARDSVDPHSALIQDFRDRVESYRKLRKVASAGLTPLKLTDSPAAIADRARELAQRIREARPAARQGEIFAPEIGAEFQRLLGIALQGPNAKHIRESLRHAEPVQLSLGVNDAYPADVPLQSTPPTMLLNLPKLPKELAYRIVGQALVLLDVEANLVVDFMNHAIN
jgi:hypothetical protein